MNSASLGHLLEKLEQYRAQRESIAVNELQVRQRIQRILQSHEVNVWDEDTTKQISVGGVVYEVAYKGESLPWLVTKQTNIAALPANAEELVEAVV